MERMRGTMSRVLEEHLWILKAYIPHLAAISLRVLRSGKKGKALQLFGVSGFAPASARRMHVPIKGTVAGEALEKGVIFVPDLFTDQRFSEDDRRLAREQDLKAVVAGPLIYAGQAIGTAMLYSSRSYGMTDQILESLSHIFSQATDYVRSHLEQEALLRINQVLLSTNQQAAFDVVCHETAELFASTGAIIYRLMGHGQVRLISGYAQKEIPPHGKGGVFRISEDLPFLRRVAERRQVQVIEGSDPELRFIHEIMHLQKTQALLVAPLLVRQELCGFFVVNQSANRQPFSEDDQRLLEQIAGHASYLLTEMDYQQQLAACRSSNVTSELAAQIVHEVRNSLVGIGFYSKKMSETDFSLPDQLREAAAVISTESKRLEVWIRDLERYFQLKKVFPMISFNFILELKELLEEASRSKQAQGKRIEAKIEVEKIRVLGNWSLLRQAFLNMIYNGLEAIKPGESLEVTVRAEGEAIIVSLTNPGEIPESVLPHVFDLFFSTKREGTGIGLSHAQEVIIRHNWDLTCSSENGQTTFKVTIPLKEE